MSEQPPKQPVTPEQILMKLLMTNTDILQKVTSILQQQIIYTNILLFPDNDGPTPDITATTGKTDELGDKQEIPKPSGTEHPSSKSISKKD